MRGSDHGEIGTVDKGEGSRVKSVYVGRGEIAEMVSQIQASSPVLERIARSLKTSETIKQENAEATLEQVTDLTSDADKKGDMAWFERNFADDFYAISTMTGKLNTKAAELAEIRNRKEVFDSAVASDMDVRVEGNTGIVTGVYHLKGRDEKGQPMDRRIRFTDVYVKRDGRWLVLASQGTLIQ
ncbi:MAG: nuclear transport factor 2 family protein [Pyrinomonadaceae bacterium]